MYVCDYGYTNIYQEELDKILEGTNEEIHLDVENDILEGDNDMATNKYGFTKMTPNEFKTWIHKQGNYKYTGIQIHHTWKPDYSNFFKADGSHEDELTRQNNTKHFHVNTNGWGDIAQHFTIFPNGTIVTGRKLSNTTAIGIRGWNSNKICIEMYGNFDKGHDVMTKEQREAVIVVYGELCKKFKITPSTSTLRCHAWFTSSGGYLGDYNSTKSAKTCPGTNFMGFGNSKSAIQNNFIPLIKNYINGVETKPVDNVSTACGVYRVNSPDGVLNVRKGPGASYAISCVVKNGEAFTITKINNNWGYLKSGAGWINLKYTVRVK